MDQTVEQSGALPVGLFWWNRAMNFGDDLARDVVSCVSGRPVTWARPVKAQLFAVGSIMSLVRRGALRRGSKVKPFLWGCGCMGPMQADFIHAVEPVKIVRGPITASFLGLQDVAFGDPGLLANQAHPRHTEQQDIIGLVPHHSEVDDPAIRSLVESDAKLRLIDSRRPAKVVCTEIADCAKIYSSSLHGLVVADSYSVPNYWFVNNNIHRSSTLKFYDYAAGIERAMHRPLGLENIAEHAARTPEANLAYQDGIDECRASLVESFPAIETETERQDA